MEIYLLQSIYNEMLYEQILLHLPEIDIWIGDDGYSQEGLTIMNYTPYFWKSVKNMKEDYLVKIGEL